MYFTICPEYRGKKQALLGREEVIHALKARFADITQRERDVMSLVVIGLLNKQVGSRLGISEVTVKNIVATRCER
jgi:FixJ family two-component response regulator